MLLILNPTTTGYTIYELGSVRTSLRVGSVDELSDDGLVNVAMGLRFTSS